MTATSPPPTTAGGASPAREGEDVRVDAELSAVVPRDDPATKSPFGDHRRLRRPREGALDRLLEGRYAGRLRRHRRCSPEQQDPRQGPKRRAAPTGRSTGCGAREDVVALGPGEPKVEVLEPVRQRPPVLRRTAKAGTPARGQQPADRQQPVQVAGRHDSSRSNAATSYQTSDLFAALNQTPYSCPSYDARCGHTRE